MVKNPELEHKIAEAIYKEDKKRHDDFYKHNKSQVEYVWKGPFVKETLNDTNDFCNNGTEPKFTLPISLRKKKPL
jgi:hypothetical protein